jgi:hypothetical protein
MNLKPRLGRCDQWTSPFADGMTVIEASIRIVTVVRYSVKIGQENA